MALEFKHLPCTSSGDIYSEIKDDIDKIKQVLSLSQGGWTANEMRDSILRIVDDMEWTIEKRGY